MAFLTAEWRDLVMLNWEVPAPLLAGLVPRGTELDAWQGRTLVSVVGFRFLNTRVLGRRMWGHVNFEEVNLRFYVKRECHGELRRGVVFVKEIVPRRCIALLARRLYNENYIAAPMSHEIERSSEEMRVRYAWQLGGRTNSVSARCPGSCGVMLVGSPQEFIAEHYWGYCRQRDGSTLEYQVAHPRWHVAEVHDCQFDCDVASVYGPEWVEPLAGPPVSAFLADGSAVEVGFGQRF